MTNIKEVFKHRGRTCVVIEMSLMGVGSYHNGYVSVAPRNKRKSYNDFIERIETDELTFSGNMNYVEDKRIPKDKFFLGFDSAHYWNDEKPESKTFKSVKKRTMELADEMVRKGI